MKSMRTTTIAMAVATVLLSGGCASKFDTLLASSDTDAKYRGAFEFFEKGQYDKAGQLFESLAVLTNNTSRDDTVQYYQGLSNYKAKDYVKAEAQLSTFVSHYPRSPFTEEASYLDIDCLYRETYRYELDQMPTYTAMTSIGEFIRNFPESDHISDCRAMLKELNDRLDRKAFENARLYYKMEDYLAARVAFRNILKDDAENIYREDILYYVAMSSYNYARLSVREKQKDRYLTFVDDYLNFVGEISESPYRRELDAMYARAQRALGKYSGIDEEIETKQKDFEKARKAAERAEEKRAAQK